MLGLQNGNGYGREFIKNLNREGEYAVGDGHPCLAHSLSQSQSVKILPIIYSWMWCWQAKC